MLVNALGADVLRKVSANFRSNFILWFRTSFVCAVKGQ